MRSVYYEPAGRIQNAQWDLINYPPEGFQFTTSTKEGLLGKAVRSNFIFNKLRLQVLDRIVPLNLVKSALIPSTPKGVDLIYSYNHMVMKRVSEVPWVVQVEWPHILIGRGSYWISRKRLEWTEKFLLSSNCKKIFTWTQAAYNAFRMYPHWGPLQAKIEIVPPAICRKPGVERAYSKETINLLFVGSTNDINDFELKGGYEVMKAAYDLKEHYKKVAGGAHKIHLIVRASVPKYWKKVVGNSHTIEILDSPISESALDKLYREADIFVFPSHLPHNHTPLEAMSYGLPVVTTYMGSSFGEYIENDVTGLVCPSEKSSMRYLVGNNILRSETRERLDMVQEAKEPNWGVVQFLTESISKLIESPELRKQMGEAGRYEIEEGKFSIKRRNERLKKIFEEALS